MINETHVTNASHVINAKEKAKMINVAMMTVRVAKMAAGLEEDVIETDIATENAIRNDATGELF